MVTVIAQLKSDLMNLTVSSKQIEAENQDLEKQISGLESQHEQPRGSAM